MFDMTLIYKIILFVDVYWFFFFATFSQILFIDTFYYRAAASARVCMRRDTDDAMMLSVISFFLYAVTYVTTTCFVLSAEVFPRRYILRGDDVMLTPEQRRGACVSILFMSFVA